MNPAEAGMLVVTSNWALGDGTLVRCPATWHGVVPTAIHRAVVRAGFRRDGTYRPVAGVDLVVAGDAFNWLLSAEWCGRLRPWHGGAATRDALYRVAARSIRRGRQLLVPLARWGAHGLAVPQADGRGRPGRGTVTVPVRVTLLSGDRDAALCDVARRPARQPFAVGETWTDGSVTIRHGHELDPACHVTAPDGSPSRHGRPPTLAESVAVELVARFAGAVGRQPGTGRLISLLGDSSPVDIPFAVAAWRAAADGAPSAAGADRAAIEDAWRRGVAAWFAEARRCVPSCEVEFDALHALAEWLDGAFRPRPHDRTMPAGIRRLAAAPSGAMPSESVAARSGSLPQVVLGHVARATPAGPATSPSVGLAAPLGHVSAEDSPPPIVTLQRGQSPLRWEWVAAADRRAAVVTIDSARRDGGHGGRIVDAA